MNSSGKRIRLRPADVSTLCDLLMFEEKEYRRLLRLAWRQTGYLRRQDVQRLENNAEQWRKYLPQADAARIRREAFLSKLADQLGLADERLAPQFLLDRADNNQRTMISEAVHRLVDVTSDLNRQNELNRQLTGFCLELAYEENRIFQEVVLEDPGGGYEDTARKTKSAPGKVIRRRA